MNRTDWGDADFRLALSRARQQHRAGAGTVAAALLRSVPAMHQEALWRWMRDSAGIVVLLEGAVSWQQLVHHPLNERLMALGVGVVHIDNEQRPRAALADPWDEELVNAVAQVWGGLPDLAAAVVQTRSRSRHDQASPGAALAPGGDGAVVEFVRSALQSALDKGASDVHFECDRGGVSVRHRLDGVLVRFARMDGPTQAEEVISRIKVMALLDITERRVPQDGRLQFDAGTQQLAMRVSIMPSVVGEDAVLRLLDKAQLRGNGNAPTLESLGFDATLGRSLRGLSALPHGMLLVTGPTGSGKTTTVYALLSEINRGIEKVITIEDPVEYELTDALQIPVNERKGLTFAKGLRSILRHDPDRILVGEIRDAETAEIAVQSALTGHQVFTTVHANSIYDILGRFRHFGLDMFGFMSALNGVVVQRLLRAVCPLCARQAELSGEEQAWLRQYEAPATHACQAVGCENCQGTGYRGRMVAAEVHFVDDALRDIVMDNSAMSRVRAHVRDAGGRSLQAMCADMVVAGRTTIDEVRRVVGLG